MMSVCSILLTIAVFSELNRLSVTMALPSTKVEDGVPEQEDVDLILGDEILTEPAVGPSMYRRSMMLGNSIKDDGIPKVIIIPLSLMVIGNKDGGQRRHLGEPELRVEFLYLGSADDTTPAPERGHGVRELNSAFTRSVPQLSERSLSHPPGEFPLKIDQRDKDLDMLRCMIGRVYRPCWEA